MRILPGKCLLAAIRRTRLDFLSTNSLCKTLRIHPSRKWESGIQKGAWREFLSTKITIVRFLSLSQLSIADILIDVMRLLRLDPSRHLISHSIRLLSHATPGIIERRSSTSSNSGLPNPFKVLKSLSAEQAPVVDDDHRSARIEMGEPCDLGCITVDGSVLGVRAYPSPDGEVDRIIIWSDEGISVC